MKKEKGFLLKYLGGVFGSKEPDPEQLRLDLRRQQRTLDNEARKLSVEQTRLGIRMNKLTNKGVKAAQQGDTFARREAARELRQLRIERQDIEGQRNILSKTALVARRAIRRLEWATEDSALETIKILIETLTNPQLESMLTDITVRSEDVGAWVDQQIGLVQEENERDADLEASQLAEDEALFDKLAEVIEKGDEAEAARVKSELTGDPAFSEAPETETEAEDDPY